MQLACLRNVNVSSARQGGKKAGQRSTSLCGPRKYTPLFQNNATRNRPEAFGKPGNSARQRRNQFQNAKGRIQSFVPLSSRVTSVWVASQREASPSITAQHVKLLPARVSQSQVLHLPSSSLLMIWGKQWKMA